MLMCNACKNDKGVQLVGLMYTKYRPTAFVSTCSHLCLLTSRLKSIRISFKIIKTLLPYVKTTSMKRRLKHLLRQKRNDWPTKDNEKKYRYYSQKALSSVSIYDERLSPKAVTLLAKLLEQ